MNDNKIDISVIIPVYNVEKYLQDCIDSLMAQTINNIEYIFVNDCSPDGSIDILKKNKCLYPDKIRIIDLPENRCQGGARNAGIRVARGKYIGFVDGDDFIAPDMYEVLFKAIIENDSDVAFIQYSAVKDTEIYNSFFTKKNSFCKSPLFQWDKRIVELNNKNLDDNGRMEIQVNPIGGVVCGVWKKDIIIQNVIYFPEHLKYEDNYWVSIIKCYLTKVTFIPLVKYFYRMNPMSTVHQKNAVHNYDRTIIEGMLINEIKKRNFFDKYYPVWEYFQIIRFMLNTYLILLNNYDAIDENTLKKLPMDLEKNHPKWRVNVFLKREKKKAFLIFLITTFPVCFAYIYIKVAKIKKWIEQ